VGASLALPSQISNPLTPGSSVSKSSRTYLFTIPDHWRPEVEACSHLKSHHDVRLSEHLSVSFLVIQLSQPENSVGQSHDS
jgi:hypothetical protein